MEPVDFLTIGKPYRNIRLRTYFVWMTISIIANLCNARTVTAIFIRSYLSMIVWLMLIFKLMCLQVGTTVKFNPPTGTDTMMKSGGQQSINTRHQCITCMKEYENKSIEELRFEDYAANRKGPGAGGVAPLGGGGGGLFGASQPSTGLFGAQPQQQAQQGGMFGQPSKPLFGAATTSAFGMPTASPFSTATSAFGATSVAGNTGLFGSKPAGFGTTTTASSSFGFGQTSTAGGGLFGQAKPFAAAAPQQQGGLFGSTTPAFGATTTPAFGATNTTGTFGQPAPNQQIGLFGQPANKPVGTAFGSTFGAQTSTAAPAFGFGASSTTTQANPFGQQNKPAFGFGAATSAAPAFGAQTAAPAFGAAQPQQGGLFSSQPKAPFSFGAATSQPSMGFGAPSAFNPSTSIGGGGLFGAAPQKPGGLFGTTPAFGSTTTMPLSTGFGASTGGFGGGFGTAGTSSFGFNSTMQQQPFQQQQQQQQSVQPPPVIQQQLEVLTHNPYGDNPLFKNPYADAKKCEELLKPTNPAAQKAMNANQYKVSPHRNIKAKPKPISSGNIPNKYLRELSTILNYSIVPLIPNACTAIIFNICVSWWKVML